MYIRVCSIQLHVAAHQKFSSAGSCVKPVRTEVHTACNSMSVISPCFAVPPAIDSAPSAYQVIEGNGVILFCNATGNPQPNITWTKQGNNSKLSTSETLNLTKLMREDDGSVYKCTVINEVGSAEATSPVTVFCKLLQGKLQTCIKFHEKLILPFYYLNTSMLL